MILQIDQQSYRIKKGKRESESESFTEKIIRKNKLVSNKKLLFGHIRKLTNSNF